MTPYHASGWHFDDCKLFRSISHILIKPSGRGGVSYSHSYHPPIPPIPLTPHSSPSPLITSTHYCFGLPLARLPTAPSHIHHFHSHVHRYFHPLILSHFIHLFHSDPYIRRRTYHSLTKFPRFRHTGLPPVAGSLHSMLARTTLPVASSKIPPPLPPIFLHS